MVKRKKTQGKQRSTKHSTENKRSINTIPTKSGGEIRCSGRVEVPGPHVAPGVLIVSQTRW